MSLCIFVYLYGTGTLILSDWYHDIDIVIAILMSDKSRLGIGICLGLVSGPPNFWSINLVLVLV